jgi:lipoprotein-anchoring transpeptidase ErfK/SrfK
MLDRRGFALAVMLVCFAPAASAQDYWQTYCAQNPSDWRCQGSWARPPAYYPRQTYPGYRQAYPGYQQAYPGYEQRSPEYAPQPQYRRQPSWREQEPEPERREASRAPVDPALVRQYGSMYAAIEGESFPIPAVRLSDVDPAYLRKTVPYSTAEPPGTIVIDPQNHFLYLVQGGGKAVRYGVGVGRQGFGWSGTANIHDKQEWPDWYPPREMLARQPELMRHMSELRSGIGMHGGPRNPLGARALYLWQGNKDTLFRIHGTIEPWTIGKNVSSGCIRMLNQDVIDLYERVPVGAKVVVLGSRVG